MLQTILANRPLVTQVVKAVQEYYCGIGSVEAFERLNEEFQTQGPFAIAHRYDVLVDDSGEEFAMQFMSAANEYFGTNIY